MGYITFVHASSDSAGDYYLAVPGFWDERDGTHRGHILRVVSSLTGEDRDDIILEAVASVRTDLDSADLL